jgi:hypothetical protein
VRFVWGVCAVATALVVAVACTSDPESVGTVVVPSASDAGSGTDARAVVPPPAPVDAGLDADADAAPPVLRRVSGHVDYQGDVAGATVTLMAPFPATTTTDPSGDFFFYVPVGSTAIMKVEAPNLFPMIRGWTATDPPGRIRNFYLAGPPEVAAAQALNVSFDPAKGIVEVDFRNASVGGYGTTMTSGASVIAAGFGIVLDGMGNPALSQKTLVGGDGSTLLLGNVQPTPVTFAPIVPDAGAMACTPCDAPSLPIQPNTVTWFDFECGSAKCQ